MLGPVAAKRTTVRVIYSSKYSCNKYLHLPSHDQILLRRSNLLTGRLLQALHALMTEKIFKMPFQNKNKRILRALYQ